MNSHSSVVKILVNLVVIILQDAIILDHFGTFQDQSVLIFISFLSNGRQNSYSYMYIYGLIGIG